MKYYKVLDGEKSHAGGFPYKIGEVNVTDNWNPLADNPKDFGGFNFSVEDKILRWTIRGNTLYDVEIPEDAEIIEVENQNAPHGVFRSNKIILTNPRLIDEEIMMNLYKKSDLPEKSYFQCLSFLSIKGYPNVCMEIIKDHVDSSNIKEAMDVFNTFLEISEEDQNESYKSIRSLLESILKKS